eukprot:Lankesteria_metandrocarpae@DN4709_c0_g1_i2.p1
MQAEDSAVQAQNTTTAIEPQCDDSTDLMAAAANNVATGLVIRIPTTDDTVAQDLEREIVTSITDHTSAERTGAEVEPLAGPTGDGGDKLDSNTSHEQAVPVDEAVPVHPSALDDRSVDQGTAYVSPRQGGYAMPLYEQREIGPVSAVENLLIGGTGGNVEEAKLLRPLVFMFPEGIPKRLRGAAWKCMLGLTHKRGTNQTLALSQYLQQGKLDEANQRVIHSDVHRTRAHLAEFRDPAVRREMEYLLTFYCKLKSFKYKQGLNEVIAPILFLKSEEFSIAEVYNCFYAFVNRYLPMFVDDEFTSLQCSFHLFRHLLIYHDPSLSTFLAFHGISPELYVTPWFLTVFASKTQIDHLLCLWDYYIAEDDRIFFCFIALSLLMLHKKELMNTESSQIPEMLTRITFADYAHLHQVWILAKEIKFRTPTSFAYRMSTSQKSRLSQHNSLKQLENETAFFVLPQEVLRHAYGLTTSSNAQQSPLPPTSGDNSGRVLNVQGGSHSWKLLFLDLRPKWQFDNGRLPPAIHVDMTGDWLSFVARLTLPESVFPSSEGPESGTDSGTQSYSDLVPPRSDRPVKSPKRSGRRLNIFGGSGSTATPSRNQQQQQLSPRTLSEKGRGAGGRPKQTRKIDQPRSKSVNTRVLCSDAADPLPTARSNSNELSGSIVAVEADGVASNTASASQSPTAAGGPPGLSSCATKAVTSTEDTVNEWQQTSQRHHICLIAADDENLPEALKVYQMITEHLSLRWVSIAQGGFKACHQIALQAGFELVDHQTLYCRVCSPDCSHPISDGRSARGVKREKGGGTWRSKIVPRASTNTASTAALPISEQSNATLSADIPNSPTSSVRSQSAGPTRSVASVDQPTERTNTMVRLPVGAVASVGPSSGQPSPNASNSSSSAAISPLGWFASMRRKSMKEVGNSRQSDDVPEEGKKASGMQKLLSNRSRQSQQSAARLPQLGPWQGISWTQLTSKPGVRYFECKIDSIRIPAVPMQAKNPIQQGSSENTVNETAHGEESKEGVPTETPAEPKNEDKSGKEASEDTSSTRAVCHSIAVDSDTVALDGDKTDMEPSPRFASGPQPIVGDSLVSKTSGRKSSSFGANMRISKSKAKEDNDEDATAPQPTYSVLPDAGTCFFIVTPVQIAVLSDPRKGRKRHVPATAATSAVAENGSPVCGQETAADPVAPTGEESGLSSATKGVDQNQNIRTPEVVDVTVSVYAKFLLADIMKITSKRANNKMLYFYFSDSPNEPHMRILFETEQLAHLCIEVVRGMHGNLRMKQKSQLAQKGQPPEPQT